MLLVIVINWIFIVGVMSVVLGSTCYQLRQSVRRRREYEEHVVRQNREWEEQLRQNPVLRRIVEHQELEVDLYGYYRAPRPKKMPRVPWQKEGF